MIFDHCLPFDVTRAYDEATKYRDPRIWTAQRDKEMWGRWKAERFGAFDVDSDLHESGLSVRQACSTWTARHGIGR